MDWRVFTKQVLWHLLSVVFGVAFTFSCFTFSSSSWLIMNAIFFSCYQGTVGFQTCFVILSDDPRCVLLVPCWWCDGTFVKMQNFCLWLELLQIQRHSVWFVAQFSLHHHLYHLQASWAQCWVHVKPFVTIPSCLSLSCWVCVDHCSWSSSSVYCSIIPNVTCFSNVSSCILHMSPVFITHSQRFWACTFICFQIFDPISASATLWRISYDSWNNTSWVMYELLPHEAYVCNLSLIHIWRCRRRG